MINLSQKTITQIEQLVRQAPSVSGFDQLDWSDEQYPESLNTLCKTTRRLRMSFLSQISVFGLNLVISLRQNCEYGCNLEEVTPLNDEQTPQISLALYFLFFVLAVIFSFTAGYNLGRYKCESGLLSDWLRMLAQVSLGSVVAFFLLTQRNRLNESREAKNRKNLAKSIRVFVGGKLATINEHLRLFIIAAEEVKKLADVNETNSWNLSKKKKASDHFKGIINGLENLWNTGVITSVSEKALETSDQKLVDELVCLDLVLAKLKRERSALNFSGDKIDHLVNRFSLIKSSLDKFPDIGNG